MKRSLGICYYPEQWPEPQWPKDAARMAELGLTWVRIGEFAWSKLEPQPGHLDFDWLDRAIDVLGQAGLQVVLGTPTATPPRWVIDRYPDMLARDKNGAERRFGSRRHYCFSHRGYHAECRRIVTELAQRYGKNPHVAAWQTDNEYGCHDTTLSYSDAARSAFRDWLAQRYQSAAALNRAWGNAFWSMEYDSFDQIDLPNLTVTEPNPAHVLAFRRFSSDAVIAFNKAQVDVIRKHSTAPVLHNYMGRVTDFDHFKLGDDLDIASWDSYPIGFLSDRLEASADHKSRYLRQGDPDMQAFHHDLYRSVGKGRWWIMEQQPGPVNWAPYNPAPLPGMVRLWTWEAFAHGAEAVCYFRWRQALSGQEQMHAGLQRPDGADAPAMAEAAQIVEELQSLPDVETVKSRVALVFDYESCWAWEAQPQGADFNMFRLAFASYRALRRAGLSVDIVSPNYADLAGYALVVAPGMMTMSQELQTTLGRNGQIALIGPRSNLKTTELSIPNPLGPDLPGLQCTSVLNESLPPGCGVRLANGGRFEHWAEVLEGNADVVWETSSGSPALMRAGGLHYLAGWPDDDTYLRLVQQLCGELGVKTIDLPEGLRIRDTDTYRFYFNYDSEAVEFDGMIVPAAGVIWKERKI